MWSKSRTHSTSRMFGSDGVSANSLRAHIGLAHFGNTLRVRADSPSP